MKSELEESVKEIIRRINEQSKANGLGKEYKIYFQDEKVKPNVNPEFKSKLRYGVHLICEVINSNKIVKDKDDKVIDDGKLTIFKKTYLCKDYKDYLKGGYKPYLLNILMYEFILLGMITVEADMLMKKQAIEDKKKDIPNVAMPKVNEEN